MADMTTEEAVFNVLNEWLDLPQHTFKLMWPELKSALDAERPENPYGG